VLFAGLPFLFVLIRASSAVNLPFGIEWKDLILPAVLGAGGLVARQVVRALRPARQMVWIDRSGVRLADLTRPEAPGMDARRKPGL